MKSIYCICVMFVMFAVILTVTADSLSDLNAKHLKAMYDAKKICLNEMNITDASENLYCFGACRIAKIGLMDENNKFVPENYQNTVNLRYKSDDGKTATELANEIAEKCKSVPADPDRCVSGTKIALCIIDESKKKGK